MLRQRTSGQISVSCDFNGATFAFGLAAGGDECKRVSLDVRSNFPTVSAIVPKSGSRTTNVSSLCVP